MYVSVELKETCSSKPHLVWGSLIWRYIIAESFSPIYSRLLFNSLALRMAKTLWSFSHSECNRVKTIYLATFFFVLHVINNILHT